MKRFHKISLGIIVLLIITLNACDTNIDPPDQDDVRTKYVATWTCKEEGGPTYSVSVSLDPGNSTQVLMGNFHMLGSGEKAYAIATTNNVTIPSQQVAGNTISGSGTLVNANRIEMNYSVDDLSGVDNVVATFTK